MAEQIDPRFFRRIDESDDELFYAAPRLVVHIDDAAIAAIGEIFAQRLPQNGALLDLMSSWRSHLAPELRPRRVVGLGLNRAEMEDNPALDEVVVKNINRDPTLPFGDGEFDGAMLTVSVQYLTNPVAVFAEVGRALKPGSPFIVSFSNRKFPTKAVALWMEANAPQRIGMVQSYFRDSGCFDRIEVIDRSGRPGQDPVYAVIGYRVAGAGAER